VGFSTEHTKTRQCGNEHRFEGWFDDGEDFDRQMEQGLIQCPVCSDSRVIRLPSTFGIGSSSAPAQEQAPEALSAEALFKAVSQYLDKYFDNVGSNFATEALKIHYGVSEPRNIRGTSTREEEKMLEKEGVSFSKVPVLVPSKDDTDA